jgi:hypothetical protein
MTRESTIQRQRSGFVSCNRGGGDCCSTCSWCRKASTAQNASWRPARRMFSLLSLVAVRTEVQETRLAISGLPPSTVTKSLCILVRWYSSTATSRLASRSGGPNNREITSLQIRSDRFEPSGALGIRRWVLSRCTLTGTDARHGLPLRGGVAQTWRCLKSCRALSLRRGKAPLRGQRRKAPALPGNCYSS